MPRFQTCPKCRALLEPGTRECPYCSSDQAAALAISPEEDAKRTSSLAIWILGACFVVYMISVLMDPTRGDRPGASMEPGNVGLTMIGAHDPVSVGHCRQYWRLVAANFVHLDLLHLAMNCIALFILLPMAGQTFGVHRTWTLFLVTGVIAMIGSHLINPAGGAGASGAACGLIGALAAYGRRRKGFEGKALARRMESWALFIIIVGFVAGYFGYPIDNTGHLGGLVSGAALGWVAAGVRARGGVADRTWKVSAMACTALVAAVAVFVGLNVWRAQERREVELFDSQVARVMEYLYAPIEAGGDAKPRPRSVADAPARGDLVREAVNAALEAAHDGADQSTRMAAINRAEVRWREWRARIFCSHQMRLGS